MWKIRVDFSVCLDSVAVNTDYEWITGWISVRFQMCIKAFTLHAIVVKNWRDSAVIKGAML